MPAPEIRFEALGQAWRFKFGFTALCALEAHYDQPTSMIMVRFLPEIMSGIASDEEIATAKSMARLSDLRELILAALSEHHPDITKLAVGRIVDDIGIDAAGGLLLRALRASQGGSEGTARPTVSGGASLAASIARGSFGPGAGPASRRRTSGRKRRRRSTLRWLASAIAWCASAMSGCARPIGARD